jgi:hypothetical protein
MGQQAGHMFRGDSRGTSFRFTHGEGWVTRLIFFKDILETLVKHITGAVILGGVILNLNTKANVCPGFSSMPRRS